jgi:proton glutamate symport protein
MGQLKESALFLQPIGDIYLRLLSMTILPILIAAIISSFGKIMGNKESASYLPKIVMFSLLFLFATGVLSMTLSAIFQPGDISEQAADILGRQVRNSGQSGLNLGIAQEDQGLFEFLDQMIPANVFESVASGESLRILFFSIILGIAVGFQSSKNRDLIIKGSDALFKSFFTIIEWVMYLLPFGLFFMLWGQIAASGLDVVFAMGMFVLVTWLISALVFISSALIISFKLGVSPFKAIAALKESILIAGGTMSTFASMPAAIKGLEEELGMDKELVNLVVPMGAVVNRFSMVILYGASLVFAAQLYSVELTIPQMILGALLVVLAAIAGAGTPGVVSISMVKIVLQPLGLPYDSIITLLFAVNPVIEPITTATNIYAVSATTAFIAGKKQDQATSKGATVAEA